MNIDLANGSKEGQFNCPEHLTGLLEAMKQDKVIKSVTLHNGKRIENFSVTKYYVGYQLRHDKPIDFVEESTGQHFFMIHVTSFEL